MRALGRAELPATLDLRGQRYRHAKTVKHDFFAATGFYDDDHGNRVVLKIGRTSDFSGVPLQWLGRLLCRRELRFYSAMADLPNIPSVLGTFGATGFVHAYAKGQPLARGLSVPRGFFDDLMELIQTLHHRGIAYVDTNKSPNIILGDDGKPHLIDFQISYDLHDLGNTALNRWWLRRLQAADVYHILKHKKRLRPDELTATELAAVQNRSWLIRLHRFVTKPYFKFRRTTFRRLRETGRLLPEGSA
jgi:hypothetical protein